jgi:hypothetical protein
MGLIKKRRHFAAREIIALFCLAPRWSLQRLLRLGHWRVKWRVCCRRMIHNPFGHKIISNTT